MGISLWHIAVLALIGAIFFGHRKLAEMMGRAGRYVGRIRRSVKARRRSGDGMIDITPPPHDKS
jgi:Sec-independent protein translocase protein TatA